ncbi:MAG: hypothetical protein A2Y62_20845 [Candidatus Fischerbacteria bacterium RBG_13_37_8]|uniref:Uncharacterized protein n=1 Tax=Candidatus Fischerbacteria bacterium RBG_13_37_8 TaxID=1817863 RepID=A0A1F5VGC7_9BACT|nr:MAG: hypothetical protein A2Y62_20845 [Candidatus Fischerbacteria bacterium RBG_13_37_8]
MNKSYTAILICAVMLVGLLVIISAEEKKGPPDKNFYEKSLHFTANGLRYWYSKEQGGMEKITGVPIEEVNCTKCHVESCDACHVKEVDGKPFYSTDVARSEAPCRECHGYGGPQKDEEGKEIPITDVHFLKGMKCMDCHTIREIHGDGTLYNSAAQEGALDAKCENCHSKLTKSASHSVHKEKLDCLACHVLERPSCHNCHFDTRIAEKKSKALQFKNLHFLVNQKGKVTLATMLTFVYKNQPMISFGPKFTHDVRKEGRKCDDCHNAELLKKVKDNKLVLATYEKDEMKNVEGVIPVVDGFNWNLFWLNLENEKWVLITNAPAPIVRYSRYCTPLTQEQLDKMITVSKRKK